MAMDDIQARKAAREFAEYWKGKGYEKGESQPFWLALLKDVFGVANPERHISFEEKVHIDHTSFIDGYIPSTHVLIEQKGLGKDLRKPIQQSDGTLLTPFGQAKRYAAELPYSQRPRWIVTCNFAEFNIYDMEHPSGEPEVVLLENLETEYYRLAFLVEAGNDHIRRETEVSLQAGEMVGRLYDLLIAQYRDPSSTESLHSLNILCVRLVFCLYAEDAGIFGRRDAFHDYMAEYIGNPDAARERLIKLFKVLDTKPDERDPYMDEKLAAFPYVNGGLFADERIEIPRLTKEILTLLLEKVSIGFDWSSISPTIFGAVFESTLNPATRRAGGMHYTSIENIHKVIDPLFLDDLRHALEAAQAEPVARTRRQKLERFRDRIASLRFMDPACGSGNFLTETYISLRRLENEALRAQRKDTQVQIGFAETGLNPIRVSIHQFYGIEINDFASTVARTALWIAESQMMHETEDIVGAQLDFLPLKTYSHITIGNALRVDWNDVCPREELDYIFGNPPFVGARLMTAEQKKDMTDVFGAKWKNVGELDYVACWYKKAADMMTGTQIRTALVSTNSICQGESVGNLWRPLMESGVHIDFACRTFRWDSEAKIKAHVHCIIVGFSTAPNNAPRRLFDESGKGQRVGNINGYLIDADNIFIESRTKPICDVPRIGIGNKPIDNGFYLFNKEERDEFIKSEPKSEKYFRPYYGAYEFINRCPRYCLWLGDCDPSELRSMPKCLERVKAVRDFRLCSKSAGTVKLAERPTRFHVENMPDSDYIIVPKVSSEKRNYIPIGFLHKDTIASDLLFIIPSATLYHFGVLTSSVHMAWMRAVCGRLKSDYRYSKDIVYNNFPWAEATESEREAVGRTAQAILDARAEYPQASLADLYDELTMPTILRRAHEANDRAVARLYGFDKGTSEAEMVAALMKRYEKLTEKR